MNEKLLIDYYNKFNENKRLDHRHGIVEYEIQMKYILSYLSENPNAKIIDIGAGAGRYSLSLFDMGYDVTAVELVKHNLKYITQKNDRIKCVNANALDLSMFKDESFDVTLLMGPMYHLTNEEEKIRALKEAKRVTKKNGIIFVQYLTNDYAIYKHGFFDNNIVEAINSNKITSDFKIINSEDDLYSYIRKDDIDRYNLKADLKRLKIVGVDALTDYYRPNINKLSDEEFELYIKYIFSISETDGAIFFSSHILDILKNA